MSKIEIPMERTKLLLCWKLYWISCCTLFSSFTYLCPSPTGLMLPIFIPCFLIHFSSSFYKLFMLMNIDKNNFSPCLSCLYSSVFLWQSIFNLAMLYCSEELWTEFRRTLTDIRISTSLSSKFPSPFHAPTYFTLVHLM